MIKVLIVEDDPMLASIHSKFIKELEGFKVIGVEHNGKAAYETLQKEKIDLLILDVHLPGMNGFDILKKIRKKGIKTDVILVTAANEASNIGNAFTYGAFDYLVKPFEYDRLKASLQKYVSMLDVLKQESIVNQEDLDKIFNAQLEVQRKSLPKGLHEKTLQRVSDIIKLIETDYVDIEFIAQKIDISKVTARRYLDYLGKVGEIEIDVSYGSRGRPSYNYKIKR